MTASCFLLGNEDAASDELAAALRLPQMITHQPQVEEEPSLHLTDLPLGDGSFGTHGERRKAADSNVESGESDAHVNVGGGHTPSRQSSTIARLFRKASSACSKLLLDWSDSKRNR